MPMSTACWTLIEFMCWLYFFGIGAVSADKIAISSESWSESLEWTWDVLVRLINVELSSCIFETNPGCELTALEYNSSSLKDKKALFIESIVDTKPLTRIFRDEIVFSFLCRYARCASLICVLLLYELVSKSWNMIMCCRSWSKVPKLRIFYRQQSHRNGIRKCRMCLLSCHPLTSAAVSSFASTLGRPRCLLLSSSMSWDISLFLFLETLVAIPWF